MRYWVAGYHVDGFRIDEAPIFARNQDGTPMVSPPLVDSIAFDPVLGRTKLISEGWDASGHCTIGKFPNGWADWNPKMRDTVKRFIKGSAEDGPAVLTAIQGSPDMFGESGPAASVNYLTCHDGMTLYDTVAYNSAHNEANPFPTPLSGFDNQSWNCGVEGETDDPEVNALRKRQMKNMISILLISRGVPMFCAGDEFANTQYGNNDAYCHDNIISWLDWNRLEEYDDLFDYFSRMITFRKNHPVLRKNSYRYGYNSSGYPELSWHGEKAWEFDANRPFLTFGMMYSEPKADFGTKSDCFIYCAVNAHWEEHTLELPVIPEGMEWRIYAYTGDPENKYGGNVCKDNVRVMPRSVMILEGK
jgi:glycogen operon protein